MSSPFFVFALFAPLFTATLVTSYVVADVADLPGWFMDAFGDLEISLEFSWQQFDSVSLQSGDYQPVSCGEGIIATFTESFVVVIPNSKYCTPKCNTEDSCNAIVENLNTPNIALAVITTTSGVLEKFTTGTQTPVTFYVDNQFSAVVQPDTPTSFECEYSQPEV